MKDVGKAAFLFVVVSTVVGAAACEERRTNGSDAGPDGIGGRTGSGGATSGTGGTSSGTGGATGGGNGGGGRAGTGGQMGGSVCLLGGVTYVVGQGFPSVDGCNSCVCTTSGVSCTARACLPDAGADASATCAFDTTYTFGNNGGLVAFQDETTLAAPAVYQRKRRLFGGTSQDPTCAPALPECNSASALDVADVMRALADADVRRALTAPTPILYGVDLRPVDGVVFSFLRADGRGFLLGDACGAALPGTSCNPIPPGIARLVTGLRALDQQQLQHPTCAQLR